MGNRGNTGRRRRQCGPTRNPPFRDDERAQSDLQRAAPGFRDRIVTIRHTRDEGGLNLDMVTRDIETMAASGRLGAEKLIAAFARPESLETDFLTYHRWVRIRSLLNVLQRAMRE